MPAEGRSPRSRSGATLHTHWLSASAERVPPWSTHQPCRPPLQSYAPGSEMIRQWEVSRLGISDVPMRMALRFHRPEGCGAAAGHGAIGSDVGGQAAIVCDPAVARGYPPHAAAPVAGGRNAPPVRLGRKSDRAGVPATQTTRSQREWSTGRWAVWIARAVHPPSAAPPIRRRLLSLRHAGKARGTVIAGILLLRCFDDRSSAARLLGQPGRCRAPVSRRSTLLTWLLLLPPKRWGTASQLTKGLPIVRR